MSSRSRGRKLTRGIAGRDGNASDQPSAPDTTKQITDDQRPCNDGNRSFANRSARGLREPRLYLFRLLWNGRGPLGSGRCRVGGAVDSAMCRSAQAVDLGRGLVSDPVGCLVRCIRYVFNLGACWIGAATAASAIAPQGGGSIHVISFRKNTRQKCLNAAAVAFAVGLSVFHSDATIRRSLISS
jgi:hypothetical protein